MKPANDLTGRVFGRLTAIEREASADRARPVWKCSCDCGNTAAVIGYNLTRGDTLSCGCLVGLVANSRPSKLYDGLTLAEHAERSGISFSTLYKRAKKYGEPFPSHLNKTRAEQELQVFEQDRENNRRMKSRRMGRAAAWHKKDDITPAPKPVTFATSESAEDRSERVSNAHLAEPIARTSGSRAD